MIQWLLDNWLLVLAVAAVLTAWGVGGWRLALGVATLGVGVLMYRQGHKDANARAERINQERRDAYREIDERGATGSDAIDRLRDGGY